MIFFLKEFMTTFPKSQIRVETTIFSNILKLCLSAELIIVLLGSYFGWLSSLMFLRIISQNCFLSISVSILFEICSALCYCSLVRLSSVVFPGISSCAYFSSYPKNYSRYLDSFPLILAFSIRKFPMKLSERSLGKLVTNEGCIPLPSILMISGSK